MSNITIKISNTVSFDAEHAADIITTAAVGAILNRMEDGIGVDDERMRDYSKSYKRHLEKIGEDTKVDHRRSGLMLSQVGILNRETVERDAAGVPVRVDMTFGVTGAGNRNTIAAVNQTLRPWFGLSPRDMQTVNEALTGESPPDPRKTTKRGAGVIRQRDAQGRLLRR